MTKTHTATRIVPAGPYKGQRFANHQPLPLHPDTADFRDNGDRAALGAIGVFSLDRTGARQAKGLHTPAQVESARQFLRVTEADGYRDRDITDIARKLGWWPDGWER